MCRKSLDGFEKIERSKESAPAFDNLVEDLLMKEKSIKKEDEYAVQCPWCTEFWRVRPRLIVSTSQSINSVTGFPDVEFSIVKETTPVGYVKDKIWN
jgi:hypothetical protein